MLWGRKIQRQGEGGSHYRNGAVGSFGLACAFDGWEMCATDSSSLIFISGGGRGSPGGEFTSLHRVTANRISDGRRRSSMSMKSLSQVCCSRAERAEKGEYIGGNLHHVGSSFHCGGNSSAMWLAVAGWHLLAGEALTLRNTSKIYVSHSKRIVDDADLHTHNARFVK